jgi:hypothetical protein
MWPFQLGLNARADFFLRGGRNFLKKVKQTMYHLLALFQLIEGSLKFDLWVFFYKKNSIFNLFFFFNFKHLQNILYALLKPIHDFK